MQRDELASWLRLALTPQVGNATARRLLSALGLPQQIFQAPTSSLAELVTPAQVAALRQEPEELAAQVELAWQWLAQMPPRHRLLTLADADYPGALLQTDDPPLMLYALGDCLSQGPVRWPQAIAIVGSRNPTPQGLDNARQFARGLASSRWCVVSGLALGVDGAAHEGALDGATGDALATIAVIGTGLDRVYPSRHRELAHRIAQRGLVLSEYPLGTPPLAANFPKRNRLIAGLSRGTLVVEAALQSGSLITAKQAAEQGKEVFAIPGSIHSPQSRGCHWLIRQGAKLVETAQDVLEELAPASAGVGGATSADGPIFAAKDDPAPTEAIDPVLAALGFDPVGLDALQARTGLTTQALLARLLELELQGDVARLAGGLFQRQAKA